MCDTCKAQASWSNVHMHTAPAVGLALAWYDAQGVELAHNSPRGGGMSVSGFVV